MDGFYNYENLLSSSVDPSQIQKQNEIREVKGKEDKTDDLVKGLTESWITDSGEGILKAGIGKLREKGKKEVVNLAKGVVNKGKQISQDFKEGGASKVFERQGRDARQYLQAQSTKAKTTLRSKAEFVLGKAKGKAEDVLGKGEKQFQKITKTTEGAKAQFEDISKSKLPIDKDLINNLGSNPTTKEVQSSLLTQNMRDVKKKGLVVGVDDLTHAQRQGQKVKLPGLGDDLDKVKQQVSERKAGIKSAYKGLSQEEKNTFKKGLNEERTKLRQAGIGAKSQIEATAKDVSLQEKVLHRIKVPQSVESKASSLITSGLGEGAGVGLATIGQKGLKNKLEAGGAQLGSSLLKEGLGDAGGEIGDVLGSTVGQKGIKKKLVAGGEQLGKDAGEEFLKKTVKKGLGEAGEEIAGLGGVEDPIGDIIGFGIGVSSLIGGLFGARHRKVEELRKIKRNLPPSLQVSNQIGA